jgi:hypothetical protein
MPFALIVRSCVQIIVAAVNVPGEQQDVPSGLNLNLSNHGALNAVPSVDIGGAREERTTRVVAPLDKGKQVAADGGQEAADGAGPSTGAMVTPKRKKVRSRSFTCFMCDNIARMTKLVCHLQWTSYHKYVSLAPLWHSYLSMR